MAEATKYRTAHDGVLNLIQKFGGLIELEPTLRAAADAEAFIESQADRVAEASTLQARVDALKKELAELPTMIAEEKSKRTEALDAEMESYRAQQQSIRDRDAVAYQKDVASKQAKLKQLDTRIAERQAAADAADQAASMKRAALAEVEAEIDAQVAKLRSR